MAYDIPDKEPTKIYQKATLRWTKDLGDYPASTWTLKYYFVHTTAENNFSITASASGDTHVVLVAGTTTDDYTAGTYRWYCTVTDGTYTYVPPELTGECDVLADPTAAATARVLTHAQTCLANIKTYMEGAASSAVQAYTIAGRSLNTYNVDELIKLRSFYEAEVRKEKRQEAIDRGESPKDRVLVSLKDA